MPNVAGLIFTDGQFSKLAFVRKGPFWVLPGGSVSGLEGAYETLGRLACEQLEAKVKLQGLPDKPVATQGDTYYFQGHLLEPLKARKIGEPPAFRSLSRDDIGGVFRADEIYESDRAMLRRTFGWPI